MFPELRDTKTATIANGASLSDAVDLTGLSVIGIVMPATWTTATLSFQGSHDGSTYQELKDEFDTLLSYNPLVACNRSVDPTHLLPWRYIKVRSGTAASAVNQGGARIITFIVRPL